MLGSPPLLRRRPGPRLEAHIRELVTGQVMLERVAEPLLRARAALRTEYATLHRERFARMLCVAAR